jgi:hypothetical protein
MNLLQYLTTRQTHDLQDIAVRAGIYGLESSKQRLVSGITRKLTQADSLRAMLEELSDEAYEILRFMIGRHGPPISLQQFAEGTGERSRGEFLAAVKELTLCGLIAAEAAPAERQPLHWVFKEIEGPLREVMKEDLPDPLRQAPPPRAVHTFPRIWQDDLITLIGYASRHEVRLTKKNQPTKRELKDLEQLLRGCRLQELCTHFTGAWLDWMERVLAFASGQGLIDICAGQVEPKPGAMRRVPDLFASDLGQCLELLERTIPPQHIGGAYRTLANLLDEIPEGGPWMSVNALREVTRPNLPGFRVEEGWDPLCGGLFDLAAIGACELGENEGDWVWRKRSLADSSPRDARGLIHVQPNFELVAPAILPLESRFVLEEIAELVSVDQLLHYRISRETAYNAFCNGWTATRQIEWLSEQIGEKRQVPQNIRTSLEAWGATFGRVKLEEPLLLVCDSPELAEELLHSKELSACCAGLLAPQVLVLKKGSTEEAQKALRKAGQMPRPGVGDGAGSLIAEPPHSRGKENRGEDHDWDI